MPPGSEHGFQFISPVHVFNILGRHLLKLVINGLGIPDVHKSTSAGCFFHDRYIFQIELAQKTGCMGRITSYNVCYTKLLRIVGDYQIRAAEDTDVYRIPGDMLLDIPVVRWKLFETYQKRMEIEVASRIV